MPIDHRRGVARRAVMLLVSGPVAAVILAAPAWSAEAPALVSADPAQGTRLAVAPGQVRLVFNHDADLDTRVTVTGPPGVVASGLPHVLGETVRQDLPDGLPDGDYVVQFSAHFGMFGGLTGAVAFAVGPAPSPSPSPRAVPRGGSNPARSSAHPSPSASPVRSSPPAAPVSGAPASSAVPGAPATSPVQPAQAVPAAVSSGGGGWSLPMPVTVALLLALTGFAMQRWWGGIRDRAKLRRGSAPSSPAASPAASASAS
jgi:methionine-rich copper-binding protein CopC